MFKRTVTFRETTLKTMDIYGESDDEIIRKIEDAYDDPAELIDFAKNFDDYEVDAAEMGPLEEVE